jgi:hypothetical protein
MSHYSVNANNMDEINPGPAAGYGSIQKAVQPNAVVSVQAGGAKRKSRKNRSRKPSRKVSKKSKRVTRRKSKSVKKSTKRSRNTTLRRKLERCYKKVQKLRKRLHRHGMKGGSGVEAVSNVPDGVGYEVPAAPLSANESYLANPAPFVRTAHHNMDNYNHFDGSSHPTNTFDQDVVA